MGLTIGRALAQGGVSRSNVAARGGFSSSSSRFILAPMTIKLNHTSAPARDTRASAAFYAEVFGLPPPVPFGPFVGVQTGNEVTLDFYETDEKFEMQHYAFLVSEVEFDQIFGRVKARGLPYWADPQKSVQGEINRNDGGRGVYFEDPSGHFLEIITRPYGSG
jgi:catechol 2,3-dioxygenase-like lactoylglutathione lyase family enzyme